MSKIDEKAAELEMLQELGEIELKVIGNYTLADAIREGCHVTTQAYNWGSADAENACALSAGVIAARRRGYV